MLVCLHNHLGGGVHGSALCCGPRSEVARAMVAPDISVVNYSSYFLMFAYCRPYFIEGDRCLCTSEQHTNNAIAFSNVIGFVVADHR